jgi:1-acyl-sn-glycerol-3-phosphate acyltransferase
VELAVVVAFFVTWLARPVRDSEWWAAVNVRLLVWAVSLVLAAARRWTGFTVEVDEPAPLEPLSGPDPILVLARHGGIGDSFALVWLLAQRYKRRPRVVLKRLLLWDPMIDVALNRAGSCFLGGAPRDTLDEQIGRTASALRPGDALLLFPEGGNWTPRRRLRAIVHLFRLRRIKEAHAAELMEHVLPPRSGGVLACLKALPHVPVVMVAHTGLDRVTSPGAVWRSLPFTTPMSVRWWPPSTPPQGEQERVAWLTAEWAVIDEWIDLHRDGTDEPSN